ncbi:MAG: PHB depolymerase family esterase [Ginsengibacter sp.]
MKTLSFFLLLSVIQSSFAQDFSLFEKKVFRKGERSLFYRTLYPLQYEKNKKYPVVIFLHGAYEKGNDNSKQLALGASLFLQDAVRKNYPAIVIFPQCPEDDAWVYFQVKRDSAGNLADVLFPFKKEATTPSALVKELVDSLLIAGIADSSKVYIGGLSQGAMGVYDLLGRYPDYFAAAFPICGAGNPGLTKRYANQVALWIFHGAKDEVVKPEYSRTFYRRLKREGADVRYTEYAGVGHNSWDMAFAEEDLLPWLFSKKRK